MLTHDLFEQTASFILSCVALELFDYKDKLYEVSRTLATEVRKFYMCCVYYDPPTSGDIETKTYNKWFKERYSHIFQNSWGLRCINLPCLQFLKTLNNLKSVRLMANFSQFKDLSNLPKTVTFLRIHGTTIEHLAFLPTHIKQLHILRVMVPYKPDIENVDFSRFSNLQCLTICEYYSAKENGSWMWSDTTPVVVFALPTTLRRLDLFSCHETQQFNAGLAQVTIRELDNMAVMRNLPNTLQILCIWSSSLQCVALDINTLPFLKTLKTLSMRKDVKLQMTAEDMDNIRHVFRSIV